MSEGFKQQAAQLRLLMNKNIKVGIRGWYFTVILLLLPAIFLLLFWVMQNTLYPSIISGAKGNTLDLNVIPPCTTLIDTGTRCITIGYAPANSTTYPLLKILAEQHHLSIASDPKNMTDQNYDIVGFASKDSVNAYVIAHPNSTQAFVLFNSATSYAILYQSSWTDMFYGQSIDDADISSQVQVALDQAILTWNLRQVEGDETAEFKLDVKRQFNKAAANYMSNRASMWSTFGALALYIGMVVYAFNLSSKIHEERSLQLVHGLKVAGMLNGPFWMSWFLTYALYSLISCILVVVLGLALQLNYFVYCNFAISVITLWLGYLATISFVLWLSSWIHRPTVNSLLLSFFVLIMTGLVWLYAWSLATVQVMYSSLGVLHSFLIYSCSFGALFARINSYTSSYSFDQEVEPKYFTWADLYNSDFQRDEQIISPNELLFYLIGDIVIALFFAWHFDYVWPGKYGIPKRVFFFLSPTFWGLSKSESIIDISTFDASKINSVVSDLDPHINAENEFAVRAAKRRDPDVLLKILRLSKTFKKGRSADAQDARALDMVSLAGTKNSILCILGHNGAGKTTLLNLLTGVFAPSYGEAFIGDSSITDSIDTIRNKIGVCAQEDILWPKLTAREHLELFGTLKRVPRDQLAAEVEKHLKQVGLTFAADRLAVTFSGGMKRRLSVAISNLGNPSIIFLDEPTTGLDPSNKRQLWDVIEEIKKDRLIVLTTHSMAEADHLGDKIAILALGRLRAIGSSLHLKNQFGVGYHLNLVCNEPQDVPAAKQKMEEFFPMAVLETESANNLSYSITQLRVEQLSPFLSWIENEGALERKANSNSKAILLDWSLSQTTLEEVFLRVTHGNSSLHGEEGDAKDKDAATAQRELKIVLGEDYTNPLGSVLIDASTTAHECRELIEASPSISRAVEGYTYSILFNGVPLKLSEEHSTKAMDFLPLMALQINAKQAPKQNTAQQFQELSKQHEELTAKYQLLVHELELARKSLKELETLREECEQYRKRIQELESRLAQNE